MQQQLKSRFNQKKVSKSPLTCDIDRTAKDELMCISSVDCHRSCAHADLVFIQTASVMGGV